MCVERDLMNTDGEKLPGLRLLDVIQISSDAFKYVLSTNAKIKKKKSVQQ